MAWMAKPCLLMCVKWKITSCFEMEIVGQGKKMGWLKKRWKKALGICAGIFGLSVLLQAAVQRKRLEEGTEGEDSVMTPVSSGEQKRKNRKKKQGQISVYESRVKPALARILSFGGLVILSPVFAAISLGIVIDDPGPVLFTQRRVGKGKKFFRLHKFRSMKMKTPHDIPTHQLENPQQYITKMGKFLRKYSLDELPQLWDIFRGNMSIVGPRPALWNQEDLVAERDKYGANDILPGLTGWAQINGRDQLEIAEKAKLDGEYAEKLRQGGMNALFFDVKCFLGTILPVIGSAGVVEGGTGEIHRKAGEKFQPQYPERNAGIEDYGYLKRFHIDLSEKNKKRVLITGEGSYIGESFESWAREHYPANFTVDTVDMRHPDWRNKDFSSYDVVFHVAGIAHADVGKVSEEEKKKYYTVNTELAINTAEKARAEGVKQFVFMSSMIIYGQDKVIDETTMPAPSNFYGDSKWQGDQGVRRLASEHFQVAVLRPPMVYGKGSKGNYPLLAELARRLPVFPDVENSRSMLYIDNLCEFLCKLMLSGQGGVYFPQNSEYTETSQMVRMIAQGAGKKIWITRLLKPAVVIGSHMPGKLSGLVNKAFGNAVYSQSLSVYEGLDYQKVSLPESIRKVEKVQMSHTAAKKKQSSAKASILILVNHDVVIYNFRLELVERLLAEGYEVHISSPTGEHTGELTALGAHFHETVIDRHGMNPRADLGIALRYLGLIRKIHPLVILTYTVKPNVYGGVAAKLTHTPFIANVTGLGTTVNRGGMKEMLVLRMYRAGLLGAQKVFFQNESNRNYLLERQVVRASCPQEVIAGSGVNLDRHGFEPYPEETEEIIFTTVGRIMRDKGTDELLWAAEKIKEKYPSVIFRLIGFFDDDYEEKIKMAEKKGIIEYIGQQREIHPWMAGAHAILHPSYHEGMSNVLLEAAATGRPILASEIPGCRETFDQDVSGLGFKPRDRRDLAGTIEKFIQLPHSRKAAMGKAGRRKMESEFDRNLVVEKYMQEIQKCQLQRGVRL